MTTTRRASTIVALLAALVCLPRTGRAQTVTREHVPGILNFARLETTIACGGATDLEAVPEIKQRGFRSIINLRLSSERDAHVPEEEAAARAAGLNFVHLPFSIASPDPDLVPNFIKAVTDPANDPAYIHCALGGRAASLWMIKRVEVDHWDVDRAMTEAVALGLENPRLKEFALGYVKSHAP
jgi:uncharacterized protein (TIGR01244 family)